MELLTQDIAAQLQDNALHQHEEGHDPVPVVKFFNPSGSGTWMITEQDPQNTDILFGLCDLGVGFPELGTVSLQDLHSVEGMFGLGVERDLYFEPEPHHTLSVYAAAARKAGHIVEDTARLEAAHKDVTP